MAHWGSKKWLAASVVRELEWFGQQSEPLAME